MGWGQGERISGTQRPQARSICPWVICLLDVDKQEDSGASAGCCAEGSPGVHLQESPAGAPREPGSLGEGG